MKKLTRLTALLLCAALLLAGAASAAKVVDPTTEYYVADYADVLSDETEKYIIEMNDVLYEKTGGQIVVVTIEFLGGQNIEDYAYTLMNEWKIGSAEQNNGCLLLLVTGEANYWAMSGSGIQLSLTASLLAEYLSTYLEPDFQAKNYDAGVTKTFDNILGWYQRFYKVDLTGDGADSAAHDSAETLEPAESAETDPLNESHGIRAGGLVGKIAGWFLIIVAILAVVALLLIAVPRMFYLRRRGYRPNIMSRTFWSSNPPPPPSRNRAPVSRAPSSRMGGGPVSRPGGTSRMGSGGTVSRPGGTTRMGSGGTRGPGTLKSVGSRNVGGVSRSAPVSRPRSGGGGNTRGGGAGRPGR